MEELAAAMNLTALQLQHNISTGNLTNAFNFLPDDQMLTFQRVTYILTRYVTPVVIFIGILGNTLSFVVFIGTHLSRQSSSIYLAVLAAVDNIFLLTLLTVW